ncbi:MAG: hypothetical protein ACTSR4_05110, partial [Candidatus Hodarchaeales archaeon]
MAAIESKSEFSEINFVELSEKLATLPKSAREIYSLLTNNGALKPREITSYTSLSNRTIRY